ncbi:hypothetical protein AYK25_03170 [Thermoplasmatales archaeon SM1-50]|nr:MAG: hypothetical protein AYK25_03170 [Thermoplasmatales archaeon SM1-50]
MNIYEKIVRFLVYTWVALLFTMVLVIISKPTPTPTWFPALMWILMYIWVTLLLPISLGFLYIIWNSMKKRLSKMTEKELIEYWLKKHSNFNP